MTSFHVLAELTGSIEYVIQVTDMVALRKLIRVVSATASKIGGKSRTDANLTGNILADTKNEMSGEPGVQFHVNPNPSPPPTLPDSNGGWGSDDDWS